MQKYAWRGLDLYVKDGILEVYDYGGSKHGDVLIMDVKLPAGLKVKGVAVIDQNRVLVAADDARGSLYCLEATATGACLRLLMPTGGTDIAIQEGRLTRKGVGP
jgi:hypothetical protein